MGCLGLFALPRRKALGSCQFYHTAGIVPSAVFPLLFDEPGEADAATLLLRDRPGLVDTIKILLELASSLLALASYQHRLFDFDGDVVNTKAWLLAPLYLGQALRANLAVLARPGCYTLLELIDTAHIFRLASHHQLLALIEAISL